MNKEVPPRIYCIPAIRAPIVAVFRRGPTDWSHVGRWNVEERRYESGAWLNGRIFPRRSDLSPDGRYLCYFAYHPGATWEHGQSYVAVSRLPWLTALQAYSACGTWTRGYYFSEDGSCDDPEDAKLPFPMVCVLCLLSSLRTNDGGAGKKLRTARNVRQETFGISIVMSASENANPAVTVYFVWRVLAGLEVNSEWIRP